MVVLSSFKFHSSQVLRNENEKLEEGTWLGLQLEGRGAERRTRGGLQECGAFLGFDGVFTSESFFSCVCMLTAFPYACRI